MAPSWPCERAVSGVIKARELALYLTCCNSWGSEPHISPGKLDVDVGVAGELTLGMSANLTLVFYAVQKREKCPPTLQCPSLSIADGRVGPRIMRVRDLAMSLIGSNSKKTRAAPHLGSRIKLALVAGATGGPGV